MLGKVLGGRYHITTHLGGGGFGQTYLAIDLHLPGQPSCVVKQLKPKMSDAESLQAARRLFDTEAEVLYALGDHDQIPRLFAHFEEDQDFFLVQEFIDGVVLSQELKTRHPLTESETIGLLQDVLTVLEFVHQQQVIHRDIKPSNLIRRTSDGKLVLIDFGAVKQIAIQAGERQEHTTMTVAVGSSTYMPSEQLAGTPKFASDIYAVGVLAIQCLTGLYLKKLPHDPRTSEILWRDRAVTSPELGDFLDKLVRYDFRQRFATASEALAELRSLTGNTTIATLLAEPKQVTSDGHLAWLERGDELFSSQRYREAVTAYNKVVQANPNNDVAWFKRGLALENLKFYEDALASYDRVLKLQPHDYLAWYKQGSAHAQMQHYLEALQAFEMVVQLQPDNYWAWLDRGQTLQQLGRVEEALASYDRAVQLKPDFQLAIERRKQLLSQLKQVDTLYHLQHYDETIASCDRAIEQNPDDALAWLMRGMALENLQRYEDAIAAYQQVVELHPDDQLAWFKQGTLFAALNQTEAALAAFQRVVQLQPENYWAWHDRGKLLEQSGQFEGAIACYDRVVQLKPDFQAAIEGRTRILRQQHHGIAFNAEVDGSQSEPLAEAPTPAQAQLTIARLANSARSSSSEMPLEERTSIVAAVMPEPTQIHLPEPANSPEETRINSTSTVQADLSRADQTGIRAEVESVVSPPEISDYQVWFNRGREFEQQQQYPDALAAFEHAIQRCKTDPELWRYRGNVLSLLGRHREAIASYTRAVQLNANSAELWSCMGGCCMRLRQFGRAIEAFERAIELKPNHHTLWYWRGRALVESGQYLEALHSLEQAISLKPDFQPAIADAKRVRTYLKQAHSIARSPSTATS